MRSRMRRWPICASAKATKSCVASVCCRAVPCSAGRAGGLAASELGIGLTLALVSAAMEAGELPPRDPEATALVLLAALIEAAMLIVVAEDPAAARERSEEVIADLLEGLRR